MKKILLCLVCLFSLCLFACGNPGEVDNRETITVGMECGYAPFNWTEPTKTDTNYPIDGTKMYCDGYDVQIAKKIADKLNRRLVIKAIEWKGLISALEVGQIDVIIAGMSPTAERKESVDFTDAYYTSTHVLVMEKTSKFVNGKTLEDFAGANVCGQKDTLYDTLIDQLVGVNHQTALEDVPTILAAITAKRTDITILEEPVAKGAIESNPDLTYIKLENGFNVTEEDICVSFAVNKGKEDFVSQLNDILASITSAERNKIMEEVVLRVQ